MESEPRTHRIAPQPAAVGVARVRGRPTQPQSAVPVAPTAPYAGALATPLADRASIPVGWVERSETHRPPIARRRLLGLATCGMEHRSRAPHDERHRPNRPQRSLNAMDTNPWTERIARWRATPADARTHARWQRIPRNVSESMAFEREPVPLDILEVWHSTLGDLGTEQPPQPLPTPTDRPTAIARQVLALERRIEQAQFDARPLDDLLVSELHGDICRRVDPGIAGWRRIQVAIGSHLAPAWPLVPMLIRDYARDLAARLAALGPNPTERLLETLAFAEGRLLGIHPFADYNGRLARVLLRLLLRRLDLPPVQLAPDDDSRAAYLAALDAGDRSDWAPLMGVWMGRIAKATDDF
jgi:hypothetical protein